MAATLASASFSSSVSSFFSAVGKFFSDLAAVHWGALALGVLFFTANLTLRSRAIFNSMRAAYPGVRFQWRRIWGAYFAAVGFNNVVPARGGDVIKVFLAKSAIPDSTYATVTASIYTEAPFDVAVGVIVLIFALTQGVFPKPPDFAKLNAFDLSFLASNFRLTLFLLTLLAIAVIVAFALLSRRVVAFWARLRQGLTILFDRRRYLRQVVALQACAWLSRAAAFWFFLDAFRIGGSVRNVMLVFAVNSVSGMIPLTPGGIGIQQALFVRVFAKKKALIVAYSVGQQIVIAALTAGVGLFAVLFIFRFRSFKEVIHAGRADRAQEKRGAASEEPPGATGVRSVPRERV
ncbi:MAG TPA: lysylphosphatidylglycerol synthase transmembrane domain-containing protein [Solirubrobacteraceae bacterium]|nr:lysylphosphatidylglycerol synthase transmembrane domain-containing protein [Solirubrobacteraceae bacterium]